LTTKSPPSKSNSQIQDHAGQGKTWIGLRLRQMPQFSDRKGKRGTLLRPLKAPRQPTTAELLRAALECLDPTIKEDFASWLQWNAPLEK